MNLIKKEKKSKKEKMCKTALNTFRLFSYVDNRHAHRSTAKNMIFGYGHLEMCEKLIKLNISQI